MSAFDGFVERFLIFGWGNDLCLVDVLDEGIARYVFRSEKLLKGAWRRPLLDLFEVNSTQLGLASLTRCIWAAGCGRRDGGVAEGACRLCTCGEPVTDLVVLRNPGEDCEL